MLEGYFKRQEATFEELLTILKSGYSGECAPRVFDSFVTKALSLDISVEQTIQILDLLPKAKRFHTLRKEIVKKLADNGVDARTCISYLSD
jgi:predicted regulator of amino acid metabolism with ACT domain